MEKIMAKLTGKIGVVTGGGTGIGRATALAMAEAGAVVVIGNRDAGKGEEVVGLIRQAGGKAVFQKTDVSKPADVQALVARAVSEFGRLNLAFNNAGMDGEQVPLHEQDIEKASALFDVNIKGVFYGHCGRIGSSVFKPLKKGEGHVQAQRKGIVDPGQLCRHPDRSSAPDALWRREF
jgi:NAD(P)-dependent dehydrogenase (short-subunit alcohol dehydrogenase family)